MEYIYQYLWLIPFIPLPVPILIGVGLILFPSGTTNLRRILSIPSIFLLTIIFIFSADLTIQQINNCCIYQYIWSWTINNSLSFEFGYFFDSLTSIMLILITTVGILILIYSDNYMVHDQGYLRFFSYLSFFNASMLGLVTSSNLIQIYIFWELVGMCSYLLIGFWFTRPVAANACQKAFLTNRVGDFGLLLGILGFYWITGSFEFQDLFEILNNLIETNQVHFLFLTLCAFLIFVGPIAKSAQFPLHVWLADAMEGPTPISALIHAATMVAAGIFLVARLLPLFMYSPYIMNLIALVGIITVLLGATLALSQKDIKRGLAYSTMSQLGYMMLALGIGSYRAALFHLITHAYSKALLFLGSGSIIHSMEPIVGYSPQKSQNIAFMGGLTKHVPITKTAFLAGTLSLCGIPPFACFWSKDEILNESYLYSPIFAIIAFFTAGLTAFYMFRIYLLIFEGNLNSHFQKINGKKNNFFFSISLWGKEGKRIIKKKKLFLLLVTMKKNESTYFFDISINSMCLRLLQTKRMRTFFTITYFDTKKILPYPHESDNAMLFSMLVLVLLTLFVGFIGVSFNRGGVDFNILSTLLIPSINLLDKNLKNSWDWYEFVKNASFSVSIAYFGLVIAAFLYKPIYSSIQNFNLININSKNISNKVFNNILRETILNRIYAWSYHRGYIDAFIGIVLNKSIKRLAKINYLFDSRIVDGITNGIGLQSFFMGEAFKYMGGGRISSYLLLFSFFLLLFRLI
uniref:NAD(P)H-quinone oxidoreductase subunit 5, chloroplastic n=1 Tax=Salomonia cantoniensis TaxID=174557 RepID=A0A7T7IEI5_9FABA|nr:NADH-plastoquinone oxidoreductase subunit 5 [Salomonia cantoniensis]QQL04324.1 NADH-plastoquinone oxidoreductase subunit 5 [Salomonia cantoniensis]